MNGLLHASLRIDEAHFTKRISAKFQLFRLWESNQNIPMSSFRYTRIKACYKISTENDLNCSLAMKYLLLFTIWMFALLAAINRKSIIDET